MDQAAFLELLKTLGQAAIFAYAAYKFYQDGRASDKIWMTYLADQNKMLLATIMQQTFLKSPAVSPSIPPGAEQLRRWLDPTPTDLGEAKTG